MNTEEAVRKVIREKLSTLSKDKLKKVSALIKSVRKKKKHSKKS